MSQGANAQALWGFEQTSGTANPGQKSGTMYGVRFKNFKFSPRPIFERSENLDPRGQLLKGRIGRQPLQFSTDAELSVDDMARLRFHLQGYASIAATAAGVRTWSYRDLLSSDTLTTDPAWMSFEVDRDDSYATLLLQAAIDKWDINVRGGKIINHKLSGMACRYTHMNDVASVVGPASYTGTVYVRGNRLDSEAENLTEDIKFKCTTAGALNGTCKVKFTKGAVAYGTDEYAVTAGTWMDVIYGDGTHASGDPLRPVQVMFSLGTGSMTAGGTPDEWKIVAKRTKATPTYPSRNPMIAAKAVVTIGGTAYEVENFDVSFVRPRKYRWSTSSVAPSSILPDGKRAITVTLDRDYISRALYLKMQSSTAVALDITINGDFIATVSSVSYYEKHQLTSTNAQILDAGADIDGEKQLQEKIVIVPYWDGTNVDMSETIVCTLTSLS